MSGEKGHRIRLDLTDVEAEELLRGAYDLEADAALFNVADNGRLRRRSLRRAIGKLENALAAAKHREKQAG